MLSDRFAIMSRPLFLLVAIVYSFSIFAQKVKVEKVTIKHEYSSDVPFNQAKRDAYEAAKRAAIQKAFGGKIEGRTQILDEHEANGQHSESSSNMHSISLTALKGEWIEDMKPAKYGAPYYDENNDMWYMTCEVEGKIREITSTSIAVDWKLTRNQPDDTKNAELFYTNDRIFMRFTAPCDGYLAVYCINGQEQAECWIPNGQQKEGIYEIKGGKEYVFFSREHDNHDDMVPPAAMRLAPFGEVEFCTVHLLFSPNRFRQAPAKGDRNRKINGKVYDLHPELTASDFYDWMSAQTLKDKDMVHDIKSFTIKQ